jgi:hypothetical protein
MPVVILSGKPVKPVCAPVFNVRNSEFKVGLFVSPPPLNRGPWGPGPPKPGMPPNGREALPGGKLKGMLIRKWNPVFLFYLSKGRD